MNQYSMVAMIVLMALCFSAFKHWTRLQREKERTKQAGTDDETNGRIAKLEDRVKVLERIVTDKSTRLKEEIDAL